MSQSVTAFAPATIANVACGYDVLGCALDSPGDKVTASFSAEHSGVRITSITGDGGKLPKDAEQNTASAGVIEMLASLGESRGIDLSIEKDMPLGSGMGSSAASGVAGLVAVNHLLGNPLSRKELLPFALHSETVASGAHADNVAPSMLGGMVLIRSYAPLDVIELGVPKNLYATIVHPHIEIRTEDARRILPKDIPLCKAISQWGNVGALVAGLLKEDYALIGRALQDNIIEPIRSDLIPHFHEIRQSMIDAGALGGSISGSGPSIFTLSEGKETAEKAALSAKEYVSGVGLPCDIRVSPINPQGARIITE